MKPKWVRVEMSRSATRTVKHFAPQSPQLEQDSYTGAERIVAPDGTKGAWNHSNKHPTSVVDARGNHYIAFSEYYDGQFDAGHIFKLEAVAHSTAVAEFKSAHIGKFSPKLRRQLVNPKVTETIRALKDKRKNAAKAGDFVRVNRLTDRINELNKKVRL